jgi:phosphatidylinositol alpha 1,6-mannosyltransferase
LTFTADTDSAALTESIAATGSDAEAERIGNGWPVTAWESSADASYDGNGTWTFTGLAAGEEVTLTYTVASPLNAITPSQWQITGTVVAGDAMALPHLVHPRRNGYLYRPGNAFELGTYLSILAGNPDRRTAMGAAGRRIAAEHSITRTLDTFERIYCTIAGPAAAALAEACSTPGHVRVPAMKYAS